MFYRKILILLTAGLFGFSQSLMPFQSDLFLQQVGAQEFSNIAGSTQSAAELLQPMAGEQLLVLKNGNLIRGFIERSGDNTIVQTQQGSRLIIATAQTDFVCQSLDSAYWGKLARTKASDQAKQISLFHWCVRNQLLDHANNQIAILEAADVKDSEIVFLNRQLANARLGQETGSAPLVSPIENSNAALVANEAEANSSADGSTPDFFDNVDVVFRPLPSLSGNVDNAIASGTSMPPAKNGEVVFQKIRSPIDAEKTEVLQVGFNEPIDAEGQPEQSLTLSDSSPELHHASKSTTAEQIAIESVTLEELDQLTRSMPKGSLAVYRSQIELLLAEKCARCHNTQSKVMPLMFRGRNLELTRRMSQRNLHSLLQYVDHPDPESSRFLKATSTAHGGAKTAPLKLDSPQYVAMAKWVGVISQRPDRSVVPVEPARVEEQPIQQEYIKPLNPNPGLQPLMNGESTSSDFAQIHGLSPTIGEIPSLNSQPENFVPRDEFDPEIFNRKYLRAHDQ